jgi:hypothetical protein
MTTQQNHTLRRPVARRCELNRALVDPSRAARRVVDVNLPRHIRKAPAQSCSSRLFFLRFPYVCPEPVLVKVLYKSGEQRPFLPAGS